MSSIASAASSHDGAGAEFPAPLSVGHGGAMVMAAAEGGGGGPRDGAAEYPARQDVKREVMDVWFPDLSSPPSVVRGSDGGGGGGAAAAAAGEGEGGMEGPRTLDMWVWCRH